MKVEPLSESIGVRVHLDPKSGLSTAVCDELVDLFKAHHLLLFRGSPVSLEDQRKISGLFGEVTEAGSYISNIREDANQREGEFLFHNDMAFEEEPVHGISFYAETVTPESATTRFANGEKAAVSLPAPLKARVESAQARFVYVVGRGSRRTRWEEADDRTLHAIHPAIYSNPLSEKPALIISELQTDRILDLSENESDLLIKQVLEYMYAPANVYEHRWEPHDLLFWDNIALQHARGMVRIGGAPRTLRRVAWGTDKCYAGLKRLKNMGSQAAY